MTSTQVTPEEHAQIVQDWREREVAVLKVEAAWVARGGVTLRGPVSVSTDNGTVQFLAPCASEPSGYKTVVEWRSRRLPPKRGEHELDVLPKVYEPENGPPRRGDVDILEEILKWAIPLPRITKLGNCARCGGHHDDLVLNEFSEPVYGGRMFHSHWATCPKTEEPILVNVTYQDEDLMTQRNEEGRLPIHFMGFLGVDVLGLILDSVKYYGREILFPYNLEEMLGEESEEEILEREWQAEKLEAFRVDLEEFLNTDLLGAETLRGFDTWKEKRQKASEAEEAEREAEKKRLWEAALDVARPHIRAAIAWAERMDPTLPGDKSGIFSALDLPEGHPLDPNAWGEELDVALCGEIERRMRLPFSYGTTLEREARYLLGVPLVDTLVSPLYTEFLADSHARAELQKARDLLNSALKLNSAAELGKFVDAMLWVEREVRNGNMEVRINQALIPTMEAVLHAKSSRRRQEQRASRTLTSLGAEINADKEGDE